MTGNKNKTGFAHFGSDDFRRYRRRLLIRLLKKLLAEKDKFTAQDLQNAFDQLLEQDLEFLKKWCFLRQSGDHSVQTPKCCLTQLSDAAAVKRDAVDLANYMTNYIVLWLSELPENKRLQMYTYVKIVCLFESQTRITSGDRSTLAGVFQLLGRDMNKLDEALDGENFILKPALEFFLSELGPKIVLKMNKYSEDSSLGFDECEICTSCWVEESDRNSLSFLPCFKTREQLESVLAQRFRETFYTELGDYLNHISRYFSENGKMDLDDLL